MFILTFGLALGTWILFSGRFDAFHLVLGLISSWAVAFFSSRYFFTQTETPALRRVAMIPKGFTYTLWLLYQIILANLQVFSLALQPRALRNIQPRVVHFQTTLQSEFAKFVLANSITLTPGTVTISIIDDLFYVHAINEKMAEGLPGEMERRIAAVFEGR